MTTQHHRHHFLHAVQSLLYVLVVGLFFMTFTVQPIRIPSPSMEPALMVGDFLLMNRQSVGPGPRWLLPPVQVNRGDIVVFHDPIEDPSVHLVKRVIGMPGDRIHLRDGVVYRNGAPLAEDYAVYRKSGRDPYRDDFPDLQTMDSRVNPNWWIKLRGLVHDGDVTVPADSFFVMGDNRNDSEDSRYWGFVPRAAIVGKPAVVYFSVREAEEDTGDLGPIHSKMDFARWDRIGRVIK